MTAGDTTRAPRPENLFDIGESTQLLLGALWQSSSRTRHLGWAAPRGRQGRACLQGVESARSRTAASGRDFDCDRATSTRTGLPECCETQLGSFQGDIRADAMPAEPQRRCAGRPQAQSHPSSVTTPPPHAMHWLRLPSEAAQLARHGRRQLPLLRTQAQVADGARAEMRGETLFRESGLDARALRCGATIGRRDGSASEPYVADRKTWAG